MPWRSFLRDFIEIPKRFPSVCLTQNSLKTVKSESARNFLILMSWLTHLEFSQLQQVLAQGDRRQQRGAAQQQHVALLPLAAAADGVLVADRRAPRYLAGAATDRHSVGSQAAPQRPRVLGRPVTAGLRWLQGTRRLLQVAALLCGRGGSGGRRWKTVFHSWFVLFFNYIFMSTGLEDKWRLTHFIKAGEAGGHRRMFGGLAKIGRAGRPNFASLAERF